MITNLEMNTTGALGKTTTNADSPTRELLINQTIEAHIRKKELEENLSAYTND